MITRLEVKSVDADFCELGLRHSYEISIPRRLEAVEVFLNYFSNVLLIRCYIGNQQLGHSPIELLMELSL